MLILLLARDGAVPWLPSMHNGVAPVVLGTTDPRLHVDRVSSDVEELVGLPPECVRGRSVLTLVDQRDAATTLLAIAEATNTGRAITFSARSSRALEDSGEAAESWYQLLVLPLDPLPSVGFVLIPWAGIIHHEASGVHLRQLLERFAQTIDTTATSRDLVDIDGAAAPDYPALSARELEIVGRLMAGDRVPAIAKALFLSPSTVRNHLSAVFRKFEVSSQQQLIDLLRRKDIPPTRR